LICFGHATKLMRFFLAEDKRYRVVGQLGVETDTGDADGAVIARSDVSVDRHAIEAIIPEFLGEISQIPPMYSALKHKGQPLYRLAREGQVVDRPERRVWIHEHVLSDYHAGLMTLDVHCSKGTYIRSLVEDMGRLLGCGAHVKHLRRESLGGFSGMPMHTVAELARCHEQGGHDALDRLLLTPEALIQSYPAVLVSREDAMDLRHGRKEKKVYQGLTGWVRLVSHSGIVMGLGCLDDHACMLLPIVWLRDVLVEDCFS
jgi:tRNA pseudouridine55 synthase